MKLQSHIDPAQTEGNRNIHVGEEYIGGIPLYFANDQHFCTVFRGAGYEAHAIARAIVAAYNKAQENSHAQG